MQLASGIIVEENLYFNIRNNISLISYEKRYCFKFIKVVQTLKINTILAVKTILSCICKNTVTIYNIKCKINYILQQKYVKMQTLSSKDELKRLLTEFQLISVNSETTVSL